MGRGVSTWCPAGFCPVWVSAEYLLPSGQTNAKTSQSQRGNLPSAAASSGSSSSLNLAAETDSITAPQNKLFFGEKNTRRHLRQAASTEVSEEASLEAAVRG